MSRWIPPRRPRTAIPAAGGDGNATTVAEPGWAPFVGTPNHPEYPSGHSCIAGALAEVVKWYYGTTQVAFDWNSTATGTTHRYGSVQEMIRESFAEMREKLPVFGSSPVA